MHSYQRPFLIASIALCLLTGCNQKEAPAKQASSSVSTTSANANTDPEHGKETGISISALTGENGTLANGVVTAYYFEDKATIIGIQLNIAAAKEGTHYKAWAKNPVTGASLDLGIVESSSDDVSHTLRFDSAKNLADYTNITITLQQNSVDATAGNIVASGILKGTKR